MKAPELIFYFAENVSWLQEKNKLGGSLQKTPKLTYLAIHPWDNKQNINLDIVIIHKTTVAIMTYFPKRFDSANFLSLSYKQFPICNSKTQLNFSNWLGNAAALSAVSCLDGNMICMSLY